LLTFDDRTNTLSTFISDSRLTAALISIALVAALVPDPLSGLSRGWAAVAVPILVMVFAVAELTGAWTRRHPIATGTTVIVVALIVVAAFLFAARIPRTMAIFLIAAFIAFGAHPLVARLEARMPRPAAIAVVYAGLLGALVLLALVIVPIGVAQLGVLVAHAPHPNAARLFERWLLSRETQKWIASSAGLGRISPRKDVESNPAIWNPHVHYLISDPAESVHYADDQHEFNQLFHVAG